jgi:tripartite-type tricarboxylate transporter receptor subunit TctC
MNRRRFSRVMLAACITMIAPCAFAQAAYPNRTVKIIAPVAPGGGVDLVARTVAERLQRALGQTFIVENVSGGGGVIAAQSTMRAAPDGYTLMLGYVATHGTNPAMRNIPYNAVKDFTPIAMVAGTPNVLVVSSTAVAATSVKDFVVAAKKTPLSYGTSGQGSLTHLLVEQLKVAADFQATHAPYRGITPAITDVLGGQTQFMMPGLAAALQHIKSGKLRPLAVTGNKRHAALPDVPTFEELGFKGFTAVQWYGIVGPAKMPATIVTQLNDAINKAIAQPELRERLSGEALEPMPMTPAAFGAFIEAEVSRWTKLVRERNIEVNS